MVVAGVVYVLVSVTAALTVPTGTLADVRRGAARGRSSRASCRSPTGFMSDLFAVIAMIAITNTTLVAVVTQPRILYGMANEDVVPAVFKRLHAGRRSPWVGLLFSGVDRRGPARGRHRCSPRPGPGSTWSPGWRP